MNTGFYLANDRTGTHYYPMTMSDSVRKYAAASSAASFTCSTTTCRWAVWDSRSLPAKRLAISGVNAIESLRPLIGL